MVNRFADRMLFGRNIINTMPQRTVAAPHIRNTAFQTAKVWIWPIPYVIRPPSYDYISSGSLKEDRLAYHCTNAITAVEAACAERLLLTEIPHADYHHEAWRNRGFCSFNTCPGYLVFRTYLQNIPG